MKSKKIIIILMTIVLVSFVFATIGQVNSFDGQTNPFNVTFSSEGNHTYYIIVPFYSSVKNISLNLEGLEVT